MFQDRPVAVEGPPETQPQDPVPIFMGLIQKELPPIPDSGVVYEGINSPKAIQELFHHFCDFAVLRDIRRTGHGLTVQLTGLPDHCLGPFRHQIIDTDTGPFAGKPQRNRPANPAAPSRHQY